MKVLFELPLESSELGNSRFEWLCDSGNRLFLIEGGKRLRTISIGTEPGKVLESANLADGRVCTSFSWNKDGNQLAMVVDKRLIYFWDVRDNNLLHYKPSSIKTSSDVNQATQKSRAKEVEHIVWSKVTSKVVIGYSSGQLLLCEKEPTLTESLVDNSSGVLREISMIESSPNQDLFACITVIFELLVMTFDGEALFYNQGGDHGMSILKFSPSFSFKSKLDAANSPEIGRRPNTAFWLVHNSHDFRGLHFKLIQLNERHPADAHLNDNLVHQSCEQEDERVVYYEWLNSSTLIVCLNSGKVSLVQIKSSSADKTTTTATSVFALNSTKILQLSATKEQSMTDVAASHDSIETASLEADTTQPLGVESLFKSFKIISHSGDTNTHQATSSCRGKCFSFSAMTMYQLFYYELLEMDDDDRAFNCAYTFERVDELDLSGSLRKIGLGLERQQWSIDSSMLAVQLTNGHILIYQTRLADRMIMSFGSKTAYLSQANEITILNYELSGATEASDDHSDSSSSSSSVKNNNTRLSPVDRDAGNLDMASRASVIKVDLKPSVLAIGPKHLAVALNNLVRFYSMQDGQFKFQEEYHSIVSSMYLCSRFVAVQFNDSRVKLHPLRLLDSKSNEDADNFMNERYFPDPTKLERISAFTLTDSLFLYCTSSLNLYVFDLRSWTHVQSFSHYGATDGQIITRIVPDGRGNKYVCLTEPSLRSNQCRAYLYDGYRNEMISFTKRNKLYAKIFRSQLELVPTLRQLKLSSIPPSGDARSTDLSRVSDAIWDTDGRSVLLLERRFIHTFVVLDHTLECEGPIIECVSTMGKQSTYATLYASHGVISFQTSLGRVINLVVDSHDDEAKLGELSRQIQALISRGAAVDAVDAQAEIMRLKLDYLRLIVLIYPLSRCAEICEYIMSDSQFNVAADELRLPEIDDVLWRQLAARAIFTSNLQFALLVYKRRRLQVFARGLADLLQDCARFEFDSKASASIRLLILLGCELEDE